jgi:biotin synthase
MKPNPKALSPAELTDLFYNCTTDALAMMGKKVCNQVHGSKVLLRGLVEYTNHCVSNCLYCGIRRENRKVPRYRIEEGCLVEAIQAGFDWGLRTFVIQGGEDPCYPVERICRLVETIKQKTLGKAAVTLSCGMRSQEEYREMAQAGADRYLIRFETSDPKLHAFLRDKKTLNDRLQALENIRAAGFQTGSGFMLGLPGETPKIRLENILLCQRLALDMVGIGPFIPHPDTPLKQMRQHPIEDSIRGVALVRLALPQTHIPATTAAGTLQPDGREQMIAAGANVLMPNITPVDFKKNYLLYPGKICLDESGMHCISDLADRVSPLDRELCFDRGDAPRIARMRP